eukprot:CAMPEP_0174887126 /NCGR_PEP_ID=MMETSP0167-20121228/2362_1 /TAXON_ID=38298 /ORGANISM="Rhodella maculata, Strain CCMP736" /LENGTH=205 /DNA_ID=CAMNT_0016123457 /DNA_START=16 /DNA_END=629 /DNA_ORIENTATION=-
MSRRPAALTRSPRGDSFLGVLLRIEGLDLGGVGGAVEGDEFECPGVCGVSALVCLGDEAVAAPAEVPDLHLAADVLDLVVELEREALVEGRPAGAGVVELGGVVELVVARRAAEDAFVAFEVVVFALEGGFHLMLSHDIEGGFAELLFPLRIRLGDFRLVGVRVLPAIVLHNLAISLRGLLQETAELTKATKRCHTTGTVGRLGG